MKKQSSVLVGGVLLATALPMSAAQLVGLWEFNNAGNLGEATVGTDLEINGSAPTYSASLADGGATSLTGVITTTQGVGNHLTATHGIGANGGGSFTNAYTLVFDVKRPAAGAWRSFYQTDLTNSNDAEYFTRSSNNTLGRTTITYTGSGMAADTWMRLVISVEAGSSYETYIDGSLFHTHSAPGVDGGYALDTSKVLLFADENGENNSLDIGMVAIYDDALSAAEVAALGGVNSVVAVPEPTSVSLLGLGAVALVFRRKRQG
ncbi:LamG-like jellyroll fold domain-containing protein [Rubritalea tangerina]|uniref:LamG-like jellyroll fold domain-containing protein n=1 Tax=Rubritalea tangerina TaxID=430798 RepID=A0ABW4Z8B5_9BACT